jgi:hypothetical protein
MTGSPAVAWSRQLELLVELDPAGEAEALRVEGLPPVTRARARIVKVGRSAVAGPHLRLRPLVEPPGPFGVDGIILITPFVETRADRSELEAFERRIGRRYYDFLLGARYRYAATCSIEGSGLELPGTCAEVYSIDAASREEAVALDQANEAPPDIRAIYRECAAFIVPGSHSAIWLTAESPSRSLR